MLSLTDIEQAAQRLQGQLLDTPCVESKTLSQLTGAGITLGTLGNGQSATLTYSCTVN